MDQGAVIDQVFISLKWDGFYQKSRFAIFIMSFVVYGLHSVSVVFIGKAVEHRCRKLQHLNITIDNVTYDLSNDTSIVPYNVSYAQCHIDIVNGSDVIFTSSCQHGYEYNALSFKSSFVSEWDLVCEKEYFSDVSQTVFVLGQIFGLFITRIADSHGHKILYIVTSIMCLVTSVISSFSPSFGFFLVFRFASAASISSSFQLAYIQMMEMLPTTHRALVEKMSSFLWTISLLVLCLIAYLTRDLNWNYTQLILSGFSIYVLFLLWLTDESIRWLFAAKKYKQVEVLIHKIARINKVDPQKALDVMRNNGYFSKELDLVGRSEENINIPATDKEINKLPDKQLSVFIKNRNLLSVTAITSFIWFVDSLAYEGLMMISPDLHDDFYIGFILGIVIEFPATALFCALINRIGRKKCTGIFHLLAGVFLVTSTVLLNTPLAVLIPGQYWISLVLSLLGRLTLSTGYSTTLIYIPELFPTSVRNTGYAISSIGAYISSTISPYTRTVSRHIPWTPPIVFGVLCMFVPVVTICLPETQGHELAQTVEDLDKGMRNKQTEIGEKP